MSVPNIISIIRILLVPVFCVSYFSPMKALAFVILIASGLSDVADGYIARRFDQITDLGKVLDPVADKAFQISTIACLCADGVVGLWLLAIVLVKEVFMLCGLVVFYRKTKTVIAAKWFGKLSSVLYFTVFVFSFFPIVRDAFSFYLNSSLTVAVGLSLYSAVMYVKAAITDKAGKDEEIIL